MLPLINPFDFCWPRGTLGSVSHRKDDNCVCLNRVENTIDPVERLSNFAARLFWCVKDGVTRWRILQ